MPERACPGDDGLLPLACGEPVAPELELHVRDCAHCQTRMSRLVHEVATIRGLQIEPGDAMATRTVSPQQDRPTDYAWSALSGAARVTSEVAGTRLDRFELQQVLGKGSFGTVYLAVDPKLDRQVAIKVARSGNLAGQSEVDRFGREARSAAQLRHPHIIPVYEVGEADGHSYIAYEYVEGQTLDTRLKAVGKYPPGEAAELIAKLAAALDYAHSRGIVHRDIKPANVIIDTAGEPHIADFGLARREEDDVTRTREGARMGTPAYMSPEQASGLSHVADGRSDEWSLGVMLYELLSGTRPFGGNISQVINAVLKAEHVPVRQRNRQVPLDLQTICDKCMQKEIADRYPTCGVLNQELERWRRGEPILARPLGVTARTWRWARRNPLVASLTSSVFLALLLGLCGSTYFALRVHAEQQARAAAQTDALLAAAPNSVQSLIENMRLSRELVLPQIEERLQSGEADPRALARLQLAQAALSPETTNIGTIHDLSGEMLRAGAAEFQVIRKVLEPHQAELRDELWAMVREGSADSDVRFRAACALALYDPQAEHWNTVAEDLVTRLLSENALDLHHWIASVEPIRHALFPFLRQAFDRREEFAAERNGRTGEQSVLAAAVLAEFLQHDSAQLVDLVARAQPAQLRPLLPKLTRNRAESEPLLLAMFESRPRERGTPPADPERAAETRANVAVALLFLDQSEPVWRALIEPPNQTVRTLTVHRLAAAGVKPELLLEQLAKTRQAAVARSLVQALGSYGTETLSPAKRCQCLPGLLERYQTDPDSGVHSAVGWLLRRWGYAAELQDADVRLAIAGPPAATEPLATTEPATGLSAAAGWLASPSGYTLAVVQGPVIFSMGSPPTEPDRANNEQRHLREIRGRFAVATTEVTVEQFLRYAPEFPYNKQYSPHAQCPIVDVSWYDAVKYCRWLSEQEGIPADAMCYPPIESIGPEMDLVEFQRQARRGTGYRLPTAAEWEYMVRSGGAGIRHFGEYPRLLGEYCWYNENSQNRSWPVGLLKPNDFGLFDVYGNAAEWCQDLYFEEYPASHTGTVVDGGERREGFEFELRGGTYRHSSAVARSAWRDYQTPDFASFEFGFRIARTLVPANLEE